MAAARKLPVRTRGAPRKEKSTAKSRRVRETLTPAQEEFIARYMVRHNATRAYMDSHPGVTYSTAMSEGSRLFHHPTINQEIKRLTAEAVARLKPSATRVLRELSAMAFSSLSDVYDKSGTLIPPNDLPRDLSVAVKKVKRQEILGGDDPNNPGRKVVLGHTIEVEMHDKVAPLKALGQHYGLFVEQVRVLDKTEFASLLKEGRERVESGT